MASQSPCLNTILDVAVFAGILFGVFMMGVLLTLPAQAQTDQYWQSLYGNSLGQCAANLVSLGKQLDDAKKQIDALQKKLDELKK